MSLSWKPVLLFDWIDDDTRVSVGSAVYRQAVFFFWVRDRRCLRGWVVRVMLAFGEGGSVQHIVTLRSLDGRGRECYDRDESEGKGGGEHTSHRAVLGWVCVTTQNGIMDSGFSDVVENVSDR